MAKSQGRVLKMGSKRIGLARTQALLQALKRELNMASSTFQGATVTGKGQLLGGTGAVSGTVTAPTTKITDFNGEFITTLTMDLTNLSSSGANGKIVGNEEAAEDGTAPAYLLKWNEDTMGVAYKVELSCIELPAGNGTFLDFNLETDDAELEQGGDPSTSNAVVLEMNGNIALNKTVQALSCSIGDDQFLYLTNGAAPGATGEDQYTAGQFVIKFYGHPELS